MTATTNIQKAMTILSWNDYKSYDLFQCKAHENGTVTLYRDDTLEILINHNYGYIEIIGLNLSDADFRIFKRMVQ